MTTTELIRPPRATSPPEPRGDARRNARPGAPSYPTFGEMLEEIIPLVGVVLQAGPPVVFVAGPWLFFALMVVAPVALLFALVAVFVAAAALVGLTCAILAAPYMLVRHLREYRAVRASARAHGAQRAGAIHA